MSIDFRIVKKDSGSMARVATCVTEHGFFETPAFVSVATKATVKALSPEQVKETGAQVVLGNTYHLYLEPGAEVVKRAGGLGKMMNWTGPTMTDSGGFQVFSLGAAYGKRLSKFGGKKNESKKRNGADNFANEDLPKLVEIDEGGVTFRSHIDGSKHRFTPEKSIQIQHDIGADIIFAFDECPSPESSYDYQKEAIDRTHRWALRCLEEHIRLGGKQSLFGIVQGGRFEDLRKESAKIVANMSFDGFGIGGSFEKKDMAKAVRWVNEVLPENKPRHLLGIGEPEDLLLAVENGCDTFDCVMPTRLGRTGSLYTSKGKINITNAAYTNDMKPVDNNCGCYTCKNYTRSYLAHLFRVKEMFAATLASIHNLAFINGLVGDIRKAILENRLKEYKKEFLYGYKG